MSVRIQRNRNHGIFEMALGLKFWTSWGRGGRTPKSPYYGVLFFYHAKSQP